MTDQTARTNTPTRTNPDGSTTIKLKRCCNGCDQYLGDVENRDVDKHGNLTDVRAECAHCRPLVELEAQGCTTWQVTRRSFALIASLLDRQGVFTKGFWETVEGELAIVGLRVGAGETRVLARYGDWLVRHPDGSFTVHAAPAVAETGE